MPVIWCWVAVLTMSNSLVVSTGNNLRQLVIRPAKVWQALDLLHPVAPSGGFLPTSWRHGGAPQFGLVDFDVPTLDLLPAPAAGRSMDAGAANQPDQPAEITKVEDTALPLASAEVLAQSRSEGYAQGLKDARVQMQAEMERSLQSGLSQDRALIAAMNPSNGCRCTWLNSWCWPSLAWTGALSSVWCSVAWMSSHSTRHRWSR